MTRKSLTLLQLNDLHGYLEPHPELVREDDHSVFTSQGGMARIAGLFAQVRAETDGAVVALDNGDTFHGTYAAVHDQGQSMLPLMNALGFDAMSVHWEFAYGPAGVKRLAQGLDYPMLAINCYYKDSGELFFAPTCVIERAGLKIGVIGLACPIVDKTMPPSFSEGLRFTTGREELPGWIERLRSKEGVDLVLVLSHLGFPQDLKMAREVDGIDVLVSGHTHNRMHEPVVENGAVIFQSGCHGSFVGRLDLEVEARRVLSWRHRLIPVDDQCPVDTGMQAQVDAVMQPHRQLLAEVVGRTESGLDRYRMLSASMDDLLLDALADAAGVELAFSNGWRYGAPIPPGPVTVGDLWNIVPTNPWVCVVDLTGAEIVTLLEANLERTFAADAFEQMGGYVKRCRGLTLYLKVENPKGHRIDRLFVEGRPVDPEATYRAAYITEQGVPAKFGRNRKKLELRAVDALRQYFAAHSPVTLQPRRSVIAV